MTCKVIKIADGTTAIMCGNNVNNDHVCDEKAGVLLLADGGRVADTKANAQKYKEQVRGGSVACSICGRAAFDNAAWM